MTGRELSHLTWQKSSHSTGTEGSSCVEVARMGGHTIAARDSKDPHGPVLSFTSTDWAAFLTTIKHSGSCYL